MVSHHNVSGILDAKNPPAHCGPTLAIKEFHDHFCCSIMRCRGFILVRKVAKPDIEGCPARQASTQAISFAKNFAHYVVSIFSVPPPGITRAVGMVMDAARPLSTMAPLVKVKVFARNLSMQCLRTWSICAICDTSLSLYAVIESALESVDAQRRNKDIVHKEALRYRAIEMECIGDAQVLSNGAKEEHWHT